MTIDTLIEECTKEMTSLSQEFSNAQQNFNEAQNDIRQVEG